MSGAVDVCRRALTLVGTRRTIQSLGENSAEARACQTWYTRTLKSCLRRTDWGFARRNSALSRISGSTINGWNYKYAWPEGAVKILAVTPSLADYVPLYNNSLEKIQLPRVSYEIGGTEASRVIYANTSPLYVYFTFLVEDIEMWDSLFDTYMSTSLAAAIAPTLTQKTSLVELLSQKAEQAFLMASGEDGNESNINMMDYIPDSILSRM